jgi:hypothetical protein
MYLTRGSLNNVAAKKCFDQNLYRRIIYYNLNFAYFEAIKEKRANAPQLPLCVPVLFSLHSSQQKMELMDVTVILK